MFYSKVLENTINITALNSHCHLKILILKKNNTIKTMEIIYKKNVRCSQSLVFRRHNYGLTL